MYDFLGEGALTCKQNHNLVSTTSKQTTKTKIKVKYTYNKLEEQVMIIKAFAYWLNTNHQVGVSQGQMPDFVEVGLSSDKQTMSWLQIYRCIEISILHLGLFFNSNEKKLKFIGFLEFCMIPKP